jgi:hypothetical protein
VRGKIFNLYSINFSTCYKVRIKQQNLIFLNVQNNTEGQENSEPERSDDSTSDVWYKNCSKVVH